MLVQALRIRLVEERIIELYPSDKIQSPVHLSIGQEMVAVGVCQSLTPRDLLFCSYRSHAFYLAKGGDLNEMFAELYGKVSGCARGKGGSMHLAAPDVGLMGASAVVASVIPHAVGAALAAKRLGKDHLVVAVFGDGATEEGVFHESLNFAALHELPVIFVCENNALAVHARLAARQAYRIATLTKAYGIATTTITDGHDPMKINRAFLRAVRRARRTGKPQMLEVLTCRYREHVGPGEDVTAGYRSAAELDQWKARDPLILEARRLAGARVSIAREIDAAVEFAERSPWPDKTDLLADVL
jgi:TPP-dependent pyruvate/acetoin dehydrogenase alpha subunit